MALIRSIHLAINQSLVRAILMLPPGSSLYKKSAYAYHWLTFLYRHKRLPRQDADNFNDFLFRIKTDGTLRQPLRTQVSDKELGKQYIASRIGEGWTVDTLAVLRTHQEIDRFQPASFPLVMKPTCSSGSILFIQSREEYLASIPTLHHWMGQDHFTRTLEENYSGLERKIIVEPYLDKDYFLEGSIHCREGAVKIISIIDRFDKEKRRESFDRHWQPLRVALGQPYKALDLGRPAFLADLIAKAEAIAREFAFIRVDFYASTDRFLFGELTNLPGGGLARFSSIDGERRFSQTFFG